jgi:hypothetical protein
MPVIVRERFVYFLEQSTVGRLVDLTSSEVAFTRESPAVDLAIIVLYRSKTELRR